MTHIPGINAAAMLLWTGRAEESRKIAQGVLEAIKQEPCPSDVWMLATIAEAYLLLGDEKAAREWYGRAVDRDQGRVHLIATMRKKCLARSGNAWQATGGL